MMDIADLLAMIIFCLFEGGFIVIAFIVAYLLMDTIRNLDILPRWLMIALSFCLALAVAAIIFAPLYYTIGV